MLLGELICTLGVGILAPQNCMKPMLLTVACDKHEQTNPVNALAEKGDKEPSSSTFAVSGQMGTGIEQPCKAVYTPGPDLSK